MKIKSAAYGQEIELSTLETALFEAVAEDLGTTTAEEVATAIVGFDGVPSDDFLDAYDREVDDLRNRYEEVNRENGQ